MEAARPSLKSAEPSQEWTGVAGKRVVLTGATAGIGLATAKELARRGAHLSIVARSETRAAAAVTMIQSATASSPEVDVLHADLSSQTSIRQLATDILAHYPQVDVLINNAGAVHSSRQLTEDGLELTWAVNHLAPFLLTNLLLGRLCANAPARIVTTSSAAHRGARIPFDDINAERGYATFGFARYGQTKLANILFTSELARRLRGSRVTANCFHPGFVASGFNRNNGGLMGLAMSVARPFARTPERGAETLVWLVDSPDVSSQTGGYFTDRRRVLPSGAAQDDEAARKLWRLSAEQVGIG
ncbi:MAG TPA: SDR family oxidoreductase [Candidatus Dormibacteraeota bacterium]|nr:SDR family oxidoreductase [Candidatus Dormibacteraeota bacterium]